MQPTPRPTLFAAKVIYFTIMMAMIVFTGVTLFLQYTGRILEDPETAIQFKYVICALAPLGVAASFFINKQMLAGIDTSLSLTQKFSKYQGIMLNRAACLEVPGLFSVICTFLTGDVTFLIVTAIIVGLFILWRPTTESIVNDLQLTAEERTKLENPEGIVD